MKYFGLKNFEEYTNGHEEFLKENPSIYHYTTLEAMVEILETKSLWATNCQYLNDVFELKHMEKRMENYAKKQEGFKLIHADTLKKYFSEKIQKEKLDRIFITSFTKNKDSVAMWRNYGKTGDFPVPNPRNNGCFHWTK